jgi:hypothetical protein
MNENRPVWSAHPGKDLLNRTKGNSHKRKKEKKGN